jgi:DNA repair exonuclease SbcCD ATPase subunit
MKKFSLTKSVNGSFGLSDNLTINGDVITNNGSLSNNLNTINTGITNITQKAVVDASGNTVTLSPLYDQDTELKALFTFDQCPNIPQTSLPTSSLHLDTIDTPLNELLNSINVNTTNIATLQQKTTDISYDPNYQYTNIENNLHVVGEIQLGPDKNSLSYFYDNTNSNLSTLNNDVNTINSNISNLTNTVNSNNTNLNNSISSIQTRLTTDEANIQTNTTNYNNLLTTLRTDETTISNISNNLNNLQTTLTSLNNNLTDLENLTIVSIDNSISSLQTQTTTNTNSINSINTIIQVYLITL